MPQTSMPRADILSPFPFGEEAKRSIPLTTRLAIEIPKPIDWQAFQRNCVLLFRAELGDPHAQEYGRNGQKQRGIDVLGRRGGRDEHFVGVQCRLETRPLKQAKILKDARAALNLKAGLKELIFATTAPDNNATNDAAIEVTRTLKEEGHDLVVVVYGWRALQILIALHDVAYNAFHPSAVATTARQTTNPVSAAPELAALIAAQVVEQMRGSGLATPPTEGVSKSDEDPALHARIDTFRDLFKEQDQPLLAEKGLLALLEKEDLSNKPWARYRLETNLGSVALDLGREPEAAVRFETAHSIQPHDPNALANLALARTIQGRFEEAMNTARTAIAGSPRSEHALSYFLQAAARSGWEGDPETLIPEDLAGTPSADLGLAEFLRLRRTPDWAQRTLELAERHADIPEFKRVGGLAVLSLAVGSGAVIPGGRGPVTAAQLQWATESLLALAERCLDVGYGDRDDLVAHINNAAMLLRISERHADSEKLLVRSLARIGDEPQIRRLLALARLVQERVPEAIAALEGDEDPENQILLAELKAANGDEAEGLDALMKLSPDALTDRLRGLRLRTIGELAARAGNGQALETAITGLRARDPHDVTATLLEIRRGRKTVEDEEVSVERLQALAASLPNDLEMTSRYIVASELQSQDLPDEASRVLEGRVDLNRVSPASILFLQSLAAARRDAAFRSALEEAGPELRSNPTTLWTIAAHAWNLGALTDAEAAIEALLKAEPDEPRARLLKVEVLLRQDRSTELFAELEKPLERLAWKRTDDQFRLATILGHFGFADRAAAFAYRLFLRHRDLSRAWMTLSVLILNDGRGSAPPLRWDSVIVGPDAAVDVAFDDGTELFYVVEPDAALRKLDSESWEPGHALIQATLGLGAGDRFVAPDGREGAVTRIRHKYVARLHYVMEHHDERFPEIAGFKRVAVDPGKPGGLDGLIAEIKSKDEWIREEEVKYRSGPLPLGVLAHRVGMDTIQVAAGLAEHGVLLKVAAGNLEERDAAVRNVRVNSGKGCVMDLLAFWTAWRLGELDTVLQVCGEIHLPPSVLDRLRSRRERLAYSARDGHKSAGYENGKIVLHEVSAEAVADLQGEIDRALAWVEANATVTPVEAGDDLHPSVREHLRGGISDLFDALVLARQKEVLLVTDDLPTREIDRALGGNGGVWLHVVLGVAYDDDRIEEGRFVRSTAHLVEAGHTYLGVTARVLAHAAALDAAQGEAPGFFFRTLSGMLGGEAAEPVSHTKAAIGCLKLLWTDPSAAGFRNPATGILLRQLIRERSRDFAIILRTILEWSLDLRELHDYVRGWLTGHFLEGAVIGPRRP